MSIVALVIAPSIALDVNKSQSDQTPKAIEYFMSEPNTTEEVDKPTSNNISKTVNKELIAEGLLMKETLDKTYFLKPEYPDI